MATTPAMTGKIKVGVGSILRYKYEFAVQFLSCLSSLRHFAFDSNFGFWFSSSAPAGGVLRTWSPLAARVRFEPFGAPSNNATPRTTPSPRVRGRKRLSSLTPTLAANRRTCFFLFFFFFSSSTLYGKKHTSPLNNTSPQRLRHGGVYVEWAVLGFEDDDVVEVNLQVDVKRCLVAKRSCESREQK